MYAYTYIYTHKSIYLSIYLYIYMSMYIKMLHVIYACICTENPRALIVFGTWTLDPEQSPAGHAGSGRCRGGELCAPGLLLVGPGRGLKGHINKDPSKVYSIWCRIYTRWEYAVDDIECIVMVYKTWCMVFGR